MAKFQAKPIIIEAVQWNGENSNEVYEFMNEQPYGDFVYEILVFTPEGAASAFLNDWIVKGIDNQFYTCKPDIFEKTYEKVGD